MCTLGLNAEKADLSAGAGAGDSTPEIGALSVTDPPCFGQSCETPAGCHGSDGARTRGPRTWTRAGLDPHWWDNNEIYGAVLLETYFVKRWATTPVNLPNSRYFTGAGNMLYGGFKVGKGVSLLVAGTGASATGVGLPPGVAVMGGGMLDIVTGGLKVHRGYGQFNDALSHPNVCKSPLDYGVGIAKDILPFGDNVVDILGQLP